VNNFGSAIAELFHKKLRFIADNRERYLEAWYAENLVRPQDAMLMQQDLGNGTTRMWVEARPDNLPKAQFRKERKLPKGVCP
jgi:hypothetical protein